MNKTFFKMISNKKVAPIFHIGTTFLSLKTMMVSGMLSGKISDIHSDTAEIEHQLSFKISDLKYYLFYIK